MFVFGLLIALVLCLVLLAGFINELMQDDWDQACARMIDKMDRMISTHVIWNAPTIETKQIKYFDQDEKVWKTGEVIVDE